jgi:hypothetical protein
VSGMKVSLYFNFFETSYCHFWLANFLMALLSDSVEIFSEIIAITNLSKFHRAVAKSPNGEMSAILIKGATLSLFHC